MKKLLSLTIGLISIVSVSQEKLPRIDFDLIEKEIADRAKENDFVKVLESINRINKNDSAYYPLLTSKSYYLLQQKKYEEAIKAADEGISSEDKHSKVFFYTNKGVALTNLKNYKKAIETYNEGLKYYPRNYLLWFNKGVVFEAMGEVNKAVQAYTESIILNPMNRKPHLQLGNIFYKQERLTQALMCFNLYVLLAPDANGTIDILKSLNNIVVAKNSNIRNENLELLEADDSYEDIDMILNAKIAMNQNYKTGTEFNLALVRQNHAMLDQLKEFEGEESFWNDKYLKIYNWISENNYFDMEYNTLEPLHLL